MSMLKVADGISAHCWSPDRKRIAICQNDEKIIIYKNADKLDVSKWEQEHVLLGHDLVVSAIDWSPVHNKIVTCSHDCNAFVWTFADGKWNPSISILRINRAALDVKWSPDGSRFAVASGAKVVPVCHYEKDNDWWVSKMVKKHKSTVTGVAWHPNSQLLATTSTDFRCRIFSAFLDKIDTPIDSPFGNTGSLSFGDLIVEFDASNGWVEGCAWSPSGSWLAFVSHDSAISFVSFSSGKPVCQILKSKDFPHSKVMFLSDNVCVAGGHSFRPELYQLDAKSGAWEYKGSCDQGKGGKSEEKKKGSNFSAARNIWANKTSRGTDSNDGSEDLVTKQHNAITDIQPYSDSLATKKDSFSTSGLDGRLVLWNASNLKTVSGLSL